jgi:hypothetical protein
VNRKEPAESAKGQEVYPSTRKVRDCAKSKKLLKDQETLRMSQSQKVVRNQLEVRSSRTFRNTDYNLIKMQEKGKIMKDQSVSKESVSQKAKDHRTGSTPRAIEQLDQLRISSIHQPVSDAEETLDMVLDKPKGTKDGQTNVSVKDRQENIVQMMTETPSNASDPPIERNVSITTVNANINILLLMAGYFKATTINVYIP